MNSSKFAEIQKMAIADIAEGVVEFQMADSLAPLVLRSSKK